MAGAAAPADRCTRQQNFKVETEAFSGFSHIGSSDGLNNTFLFQGQSYAPEVAPRLGMVGRKVRSKGREG